VNDAGSIRQNLFISRQRARHMGMYLVRNGISASRLVVIGHGSTKIGWKDDSQVRIRVAH